MRGKSAFLLLLLTAVLLVSGCNTTIVVHNAAVKDIIPIFKDYAGSHGYGITYANDQTGSYHLDLGAVYLSGIDTGSRTRTTFTSGGTGNQPMTAYEQTSWNAISDPARYEEATASVNFVQQDKDVMIIIETNSAGGPSLDDIKDYLQSLGYSVDTK